MTDDIIKHGDVGKEPELNIDPKAELEWRGGTYLCTAKDSFEAEIFESKLQGENIPCLKKYKGASNFLEVFMGTSEAYPIYIYVPAATLEDAKNIVTAVPIFEDDPEWEGNTND